MDAAGEAASRPARGHTRRVWSLAFAVDGQRLTRLGEEDATAARVAHLHLFGGLSVEEAGVVLGISRAAAYRNWKYGRAWLRDALEK